MAEIPIWHQYDCINFFKGSVKKKYYVLVSMKKIICQRAAQFFQLKNIHFNKKIISTLLQ
jgi:hypothetical protein